MASQSIEAADVKQGTRRKAWKPKARTGCRTCKRRKVKCDEQKPTCQRCARSQVICDGYEALPEPWLFVPVKLAQATTPPYTSAEPLTLLLKESQRSSPASGSIAEQSATSRTCKGCGHPAVECLCKKRDAGESWSDTKDRESLSPSLTSLIRPSGPYRTTAEQYYFKYFVEVTATVVARSRISSSFWLCLFPQAAWTVSATQDALLSSAMNFRYVFDTLVQNRSFKNELRFNPQAVKYENRAMRSLVSRPPPIEAVLMASLAFWMNAMILGDWPKSLQHSYHALKLVASVQAPLKRDVLVLKYAQGLGECCLGYFRVTRGPCPIHAAQRMDLLACDASCYVPEESPIELRLADSLHHLRHVPSALGDHRRALTSRTMRHSQHEHIEALLDKTISEVSLIESHWKEIMRVEFDGEKIREARAKVPFTNSPFPPMLGDLSDLIEKDQDSKVMFPELELRMRVTFPNLSASTGRGHVSISRDTIQRMARINKVSTPTSGP